MRTLFVVNIYLYYTWVDLFAIQWKNKMKIPIVESFGICWCVFNVLVHWILIFFIDLFSLFLNSKIIILWSLWGTVLHIHWLKCICQSINPQELCMNVCFSVATQHSPPTWLHNRCSVTQILDILLIWLCSKEMHLFWLFWLNYQEIRHFYTNL